jgi:hypothetical protein
MINRRRSGARGTPAKVNATAGLEAEEGVNSASVSDGSHETRIRPSRKRPQPHQRGQQQPGNPTTRKHICHTRSDHAPTITALLLPAIATSAPPTSSASPAPERNRANRPRLPAPAFRAGTGR